MFKLMETSHTHCITAPSYKCLYLSHITYFSCKVDPWIEERKFWILELVTCIVGIGTYSIVRHRQGILDKQLMEKVNRQIAA